VALSSAEAECMAACEATQEAIHLRLLLGEMGLPQERPTVLYEDNQSCIAMSESPTLQRRSKHIDIKFHFVRERVERGEIKMEYIPTGEQLADIMTKGLLRVKFEELRARVMGH
jgi:hypothetical protein